MTRPSLSHDAEEHYAAFLVLASECSMFAQPLGMAGSLLLRQRLTRETVRAEGGRLGYDGDALEDFVEIVRRIDLVDWAAAYKRQADELAAASKKRPPPQ